jgi:hemin uptake protein HemP
MLHPNPTPPSSPGGVLAHPATPYTPDPPAGPPQPVSRVTSGALLRGGRELQIAHGDAVYRLRLTAMGKLILTK